MTELELLQMYEPVLRFAKSERFFPMAVEPYLERCALFASGPHGIAEFFSHHQEPLEKRIGKLKSEQFYLRFVNKPLNDSDAWVWLAILSAAGIAAGWLVGRAAGVEIALSAALIAASILFMVASPVRLRIIPAALAALFFIFLEIAPIGFFLHRSQYVSVAVEYLVLLPIYLVVLFYLSIRTMKFILSHVIPEMPGMAMDILSHATEKIAEEAYAQYAKILETHPQPVYYGRALYETDEAKNRWTILQYHFFYAFNDWRLAANGMNHHEGDWEMVAVYLKNDAPYAVLFSQHGAGSLTKWNRTTLAADSQGRWTHPLVYVALGSHANYSSPEVIRSPRMYKAGRLQRLLFWADGLIHYAFLLLNPSQKARQIALEEVHSRPIEAFFDESAFLDLRDEEDHYVVSLPMEMATGDGFRAGCGQPFRERFMKSESYLKRNKSDRRVTRPKLREWRPVLLNPEPDWVQYKGLWGVQSWL
ncbi:MAG: hypothetical protein LDL50_05515, partial [Chloroflexi bacterium]|nr:hypothetical protein [Chloroflexota bacterium]